MPDEYAETLLAFLPSYLVRQAEAGAALERWERRFSAAVMMADISGFTPLAEVLSRAGRQGAEELSSLLDPHFSSMIDLVHAYGGDVVQFSGDAITALFDLDGGEGLAAGVLPAVGCALAIQRHVAAARVLRTSQGEFPFQVRIGVGAGPVLAAVVGSREAGLRHFLAGPARQGAVRAQRLARPGEVVASAAAARAAGERIDGTRTRWGYRRVAAAPAAPPARPPVTPDLPAHAVADLSAFLPPALAQRIQVAGRAFIGEHRAVTVLFTGFRGLDFSHDPAVAGKLRAYISTIQEVVARYDGYLGDIEVADKGSLLLVLFGAPTAHEDDSVRAVLCAMEMQERARQPDLAFIVDQRIGISAGPLFVGGVGGNHRWTYAAVGDEVNLASRLMEHAAWGQIVASSRVAQQAGGRGRFVALGAVALKGKSGMIPIFAVEGRRERPPALEERALLFPGEMVGRGEEIARARQAARRAAAGRCQVLIVAGEAGMGKSRLAGEVTRWWLEQGYAGYSGDCLSYTMGTPYRPWSELLTAALGLQPDQPAVVRARQAAAGLRALHPGLPERLPLLADLLGLPVVDTAQTRQLQGEARRRALFKLVGEALGHMAADGPLLLLFEDIHWSDQPSLELLEHVARELANRPVLLLLLHRPLDEPYPAAYRALLQLSYCSRIDLDALPIAGIQALARVRLGLPVDTAFPAEMSALLNRAQGNPFFLEEILNTLHDAGIRVEPVGRECTVHGDLARVSIPATIQAVVQSRLDRLDEGSQLTLKVSAVIGRTVPLLMLLAIHPLRPGREEVSSQLQNLSGVDLLRLERRAPDPVYFFKHVITQQVAYESLLYVQRQALHEALGRHLEAAYADDLEEAVDLLAHHFRLGRNRAKAWHYLIRAGDRAARAYTNLEALEYYRQAVEWLEEGASAQRWELLVRLERVLGTLARRAEQRQVQEEMARLATELGDGRLLAVARHRQGALMCHAGRTAEAIAILSEALSLAAEAGDFSLAGNCAKDLNRAYWLAADLDRCQEALAQARRFFQRGGDLEGEAAVLNSLGNIHLAITVRYWDALQCFRQGARLYRTLEDERGMIVAQINEALALLPLGAMEEALALIWPLQAFCERSSDPLLLGMTWFVVGHALLRLARYDEASDAAQRCIALMETCQDRNFTIEGEGLLGRVLLAQGRPAEALPHIRRAIEIAESCRQTLDVMRYRSFESLARLGVGEGRAALENSREVIAFLESCGRRVDDIPCLYYNHYLIVHRVRGPAAGRPYLERAYRILQELAGEVQDPELRNTFLERVPVNRQIIAAWEQEGCPAEPPLG